MQKRTNLQKRLTPPLTIPIYIFIMIISTGLNLISSYINNSIQSPIFLDSIFTAVSAVIYGPLIGVLIGFLTNVGMEGIYGMTGHYWPFALCNISTGLILGILSRKGLFEKGFHLTIAIFLITLSNAILGSIIAYLVFEGNSAVGIDHIVSAFTETGISLFSATFWARIPANLIDKMITVYLAFGIKWFLIHRLEK